MSPSIRLCSALVVVLAPSADLVRAQDDDLRQALHQHVRGLPGIQATWTYHASVPEAYLEHSDEAAARVEFYRDQYNRRELEWCRSGTTRWHRYWQEGIPLAFKHFDGSILTRYDARDGRHAVRKLGDRKIVDLGPDVYFLEYETRDFLPGLVLEECTVTDLDESGTIGTVLIPFPAWQDLKLAVRFSAAAKPRILWMEFRLPSRTSWRLEFDDFAEVGESVFPTTWTKTRFAKSGEPTGVWQMQTRDLKPLDGPIQKSILASGTLVLDHVTKPDSVVQYFHGLPRREQLAGSVLDYVEWAKEQDGVKLFGDPEKALGNSDALRERLREFGRRLPPDDVEKFGRSQLCGPYCLATAAVILGKSLDLQSLMKAHPEYAEKGTSLADLLKIALKSGMSARISETTVDELLGSGRVAILPIRTGPEIEKPDHFVLIVGRHGDNLMVFDPPHPAKLRTQEWLAVRWDGTHLAFGPDGGQDAGR